MTECQNHVTSAAQKQQRLSQPKRVAEAEDKLVRCWNQSCVQLALIIVASNTNIRQRRS